MEALIPHVPNYMWKPRQKAEYTSNYHFLEGELAIARADSARAIQSFQRSREIDVTLGNRDGIWKCDYYLRDLNSSPLEAVKYHKPDPYLTVSSRGILHSPFRAPLGS